jgi:hypothetical protein
LKENELKLLGEEEDEDVDMDYLNKTNQEENDDPMDTQETVNKGNQDKNTSIPAPTNKKTKAAPRTPQPVPQQTAKRFSARLANAKQQGGTTGHQNTQ